MPRHPEKPTQYCQAQRPEPTSWTYFEGPNKGLKQLDWKVICAQCSVNIERSVDKVAAANEKTAKDNIRRTQLMFACRQNLPNPPRTKR